MGMDPRLLRPRETGFTPRSISGLALWLDAADASTLYTTDAGPVTAVSAPTEISGCVGWYDFSDSSSLTVTSGSIDACNDKSGNGFHLSASSTNRPTLASAVRNGRNAADFDGVNDLMTATFSGTYTAATVFAVVYPDTAGGGSLGRLFTRGNSILSYDNTNTAIRFSPPFTGATGNGGQRTANGSAAQDQWHLASFTWNGGLNVATDITPYLSGVTSNAALTGTGDAVSTTGINDFILGNRSLADGADRGWDGYIGEIIIFNTALSTANRARVEAYLAAKWGISGVHAQATATNDPVGAWLDKSGNGLHVSQSSAASRPLAGTVGSRRAVDFDGSNDHLFTTTSATATGTFFCAHVLDTTSVAQSLYHMQSGTGASATRMHLLYSSTNEYRSQSVATGGVNIGVSGGVRTANPRIAVHTFSGTATGGRLDGAAMAGTTLATGSDQQGAWIGIRNLGGTLSLPLDGKVCEMLSYSRVLSAAEIARTERYLASKWNITLAPQVANADAQDWINRVYANGGTVSATTASAVNQFCVDIENAGIRDRFYRLNLFCGNSDASLNAVRTPLYRGPAYSADGLAGPEVWTASTPLITDTGGSSGSWTAGTLTMTNTGTGSNSAYPRFRFSLSLTVGKSYTVVGRLDGDRTAVSQIRLDVAGSASNIAYNSTTGVFSATVVAGTAGIEFSLNATLGTKSVSIGALSIRESVWFGNTIDTNANFVAGDYAETGASGGLKGNGTTKYLETGFVPNVLTPASAHCAAYVETLTADSTAEKSLMIAHGSFAGIYGLVHRDSTNLAVNFAYAGQPTGARTAPSTPASSGMFCGSAVGTSDLRLFVNGGQTAITTTARTTDAALTTRTMPVFCANSNGTYNSHTAARIRAYSAGLGLTSSQALAYYNAMQAFQTTLGRQV